MLSSIVVIELHELSSYLDVLHTLFQCLFLFSLLLFFFPLHQLLLFLVVTPFDLIAIVVRAQLVFIDVTITVDGSELFA